MRHRNEPDTDTTGADDVDTAAEGWTYGGVRVLHGTRVHAWIDPAGRELLYAFSRGGTWAIGSIHTASVARTGSTTTLHGAPAHTGDRHDDEVRRELWAKDTAARAQLARLAQERNDVRRNAIDEALTPLLAVAQELKAGPDRAAFTA